MAAHLQATSETWSTLHDAPNPSDAAQINLSAHVHASVDLMAKHLVVRMRARQRARERNDPALHSRTVRLCGRYLPNAPAPAGVWWVENQTTRWASCTPVDGSIRVSSRLGEVPGWVLDYVLLHEAAHLLIPTHGPEFWELLEKFPRTERARGYLTALDHFETN